MRTNCFMRQSFSILFRFFLHPLLQSLADFVQWFADNGLMGQGIEKVLAVAFAQKPLIQNDDGAPVIGGADEPSAALPEFEYGLGQTVGGKAVFALGLNIFHLGAGDGFGGWLEGQFGDNQGG